MRRSGRTTRTLWRALLHASENDGSHVVVLTCYPTHWFHSYLRQLATPVYYEEIYHGIKLYNKSTVVVEREGWTTEDDARRHAGKKNLKLMSARRAAATAPSSSDCSRVCGSWAPSSARPTRARGSSWGSAR